MTTLLSLKKKGNYLFSNPRNKATNSTDSLLKKVSKINLSKEMLQLPSANVTQQKLCAYLHARYFKPFSSQIKQ